MSSAAACPAAIARASGVVRWVLEPSAVQTASLRSLSVAVSSLTAVLIAYIGDLPQSSLAGGLRTESVARCFECSTCHAAWRASLRCVLSCGAPVSSCGPFRARRETASARACIVKTSSNNLNPTGCVAHNVGEVSRWRRSGVRAHSLCIATRNRRA